MSHGSIKTFLTAGFAVLLLGGCKKKEAPVIIEEVPSAQATETDTSATLSEEPSLSQVGGESSSKGAKAVFHPSAAAGSAGFSDQGRFVVQVSIFKSKHQAAALVEKLANAGFPAYVAEVENPTPELSGTYHRVRIGNFMRVSDAKAFGENTLSGMGYQFWVDNKKNDAVGGDGSYSAPEPAPSSYESSTPAATKKSSITPDEPSNPPAETWGSPAETSAPPAEPAATPEAISTPPPPAAAPAVTAPADTGKVNLDDW